MDNVDNVSDELAAAKREIEMLKKLAGIEPTEHVTEVNDDLSYLTTSNVGHVRRWTNIDTTTFHTLEAKLCEARDKAEKWDSVEPVLRDWLYKRDSLSGDCESLGISGSSADSGKWGEELNNRCRRLRRWCSEHFYGDNGESFVERHMKRAMQKRVINDAVNLLCRTAIDKLPSGYKLSLVVTRDIGCTDGEASIELECSLGNSVDFVAENCGWLDAIDAAIDSSSRVWLNQIDSEDEVK